MPSKDFIKFLVRYPQTVDKDGKFMESTDTFYRVNKGLIVAYCPSIVEEGITFVYVAGLAGHLRAVYAVDEFDKLIDHG